MRLIITLIFLVSIAGCKGVGKILKNKDPEYKLRMAEQYYAKKKWNHAQLLYEDIMPYFRPDPVKFEDIYYKYAYTAYNQKDYLNAENLFKTYLEIFPNSPRAEEVDFMRAYTFYKQSPKVELDQSNTIKAIGMMQIFINTHPGSPRNVEASRIIDEGRKKLEDKDFKSAQLYYDLGQFRAAATAFTSVMNSYPDSDKSEEYKFMVIKSFFRFAELSIEERQPERFEQVIMEANDFMDRFPGSKLLKDVEGYISLSQTNIKKLTNEQTKTPA